ncbi:MAG: FAD-binding protein, partial [Sodaliphilus sp.]
SVAGVNVQTLLRQRFIAADGVHLTGDKAIGGEIENGVLKSITTENLIDTRLEADHFILATGSFMSGGLDSNYEAVCETVFGLDVDALQAPSERVKFNIFEAQPYMEFGVSTTEQLQVKKGGQVITNCYAVGSVLSGANRVKQASGTGISMLTALQVVKHILKK